LLRTPAPDALLEPVTVGRDEFEDTAAEFARSVQIVSRLPDQFPPPPRALSGKPWSEALRHYNRAAIIASATNWPNFLSDMPRRRTRSSYSSIEL
jgi:hypothetical protein